jgi:superfamily II DNA/RNA helicase
MEHIHFEVGTSLLAKPQALCDILELEAGHSCIVFCNSPSDADFADVILKKRGVSSIKLVGYVPQIKLSKAIQQIQKKEVACLVLTDVAARGVPLEDFDVVVNYSVPTDPEVYFHRYSESETERKTKKVISLVASIDLSNFHYLKKLGKLEFVEGKLPTSEELFLSKFTQLRDQAVEKGLLNDSALGQLVEKVMADSNARDIIALLLHNTMTVLPSLKDTPAGEESGEFGEGEDEEGVSRGGRGGRQGGRRGDRGGRGRFQDQDDAELEEEDDSQARFLGGGEGQDDRQSGRRGGRRVGERVGERGGERGGERQRASGDRQDRGDRADRSERGDRGNRRDRGDREERSAEPRQRQQRKPIVVDKEARLYVGVGSTQGVSSEALTQDVISLCGLNAGDVHRVSVRENYSFVDVPEAVADQVVEKLGDSAVPATGSKYYVKKAVTLSIPREGAAEEGHASDAGFEGSESNGSHESHEGHHSEEGPTLLAVDDQA